MKHFYIVVFLFSITLYGCKDENAAGPGPSDSYIKLYGSENGEFANDLLETAAGGLIILSTSEIEEPIGSSFKIKVRNTDNLGNLLWETTYPEGSFDETGISYKASSLIGTAEGYIIIGDRINANNSTSLLILQIDQLGTEIANTSFTLGNANDTTSLHGVDLVINSVGEIKATALIDTTTQNLWVGTFNASDLSYEPACSFRYSSAGTNTKMLKSMALDASDKITFGLSTGTNQGKGRLVRVPSCQGSQETGAGVDYIANQICESLSGFAMVGTTTRNGNGDVFLARLDNNGLLQDPDIIIYNNPEDLPDGNSNLNTAQQGLSIIQTADNGFLMGGSTLNSSSGESDILLIKTDFFGTKTWARRFGDQNDERALVLKQASDGGYLVLGNTDFGGISTLILIKTDKMGDVK
ncbi:MAG TPA: hypothetical protein PKL31_11460 [Fulvivirga sp.]|nr:hypothetical protein [Fulvivirga sp.]